MRRLGLNIGGASGRFLPAAALALFGALTAPGTALAAACDYAAHTVERYACGKSGLSYNFERMMLANNRRLSAPGADVKAINHGQTAWLDETQKICGPYNFDRACVRDMIVSRTGALNAVAEAGDASPHTARPPLEWLVLASKISQEGAAEAARRYANAMGRDGGFKVFLTRNGWHAIAHGPVSKPRADQVLAMLRSRGAPAEEGAFQTKGTYFLKQVFDTDRDDQAAARRKAEEARQRELLRRQEEARREEARLREAALLREEQARKDRAARLRAEEEARRRAAASARFFDPDSCAQKDMEARQVTCYAAVFGARDCPAGLREFEESAGRLSIGTPLSACRAALLHLSEGRSDGGTATGAGPARLRAGDIRLNLAGQCAALEAQRCGR